jgi:hypothetical protein
MFSVNVSSFCRSIHRHFAVEPQFQVQEVITRITHEKVVEANRGILHWEIRPF